MFPLHKNRFARNKFHSQVCFCAVSRHVRRSIPKYYIISRTFCLTFCPPQCTQSIKLLRCGHPPSVTVGHRAGRKRNFVTKRRSIKWQQKLRHAICFDQYAGGSRHRDLSACSGVPYPFSMICACLHIESTDHRGELYGVGMGQHGVERHVLGHWFL